MTSREALRTQLDAVQSERNTLEAENRRLKDDRLDQAAALELERELTETRQENVRLSQTIAALEERLAEQEQEAGARTEEPKLQTRTC